MTKFEWEQELKKNLHRLPDEEIRRVREYYDELFADKIEQGLSETEIVRQFGNPVDVADKILSEYDGETRAAESPAVEPPRISVREKAAAEITNAQEETIAPPQTSTQAPPTQNTGRNWRTGRLLAVILITVFTGGLPFILVGVAWIVMSAFVIVGVACGVGGVAAAIFAACTLIGRGAGTAAAQIGMFIAASGIGIALAVAACKSMRYLAKATGWTCRFLKRHLTTEVREVRNETV